ncbi:methyltransferase [Ancylobacter pratisalsi]|uniref:Methyltransferase n=1 Tax=Ancylobacter pratisalsi TaxID=1745854 RepID=A0A6P1YYB5_9HYPH|nr:methyltransferase [Ancylobacter pratisalsi]QIB36524.1 methyltransferase [Ancylobacter pratisalsi]
MAKLTKAQTKAHKEAEAILTKDRLSDDERAFVFDNWHEGATHNNGTAGAFFTPDGLAGDCAIDAVAGRVIDLCAGIGALASNVVALGSSRSAVREMVCVEINPRYAEIGRKLVPEARWIVADVMDWRNWWKTDLEAEMFDSAISNPPFGKVRRNGNGPRYQGPEFEFHVIDIASQLADRGTFIIPQMSSSFVYSGAQFYDRRKEGRGLDFERLTGLHMECGIGVDTTFYRDCWKDVSPLCEIVTIDFEDARECMSTAAEPAAPSFHIPARPAQQLALF